MSAVYTTMHPQEELVALFSRNLTFNPVAQPAPAPVPAPEPVQPPQEERKIVYISQHYNHSAHVVRQEAQQPQRPASEPAESEREAVQRVLREHGVDPSPFSSEELHHFRTLDTPQQLHLIQLWRVCPPRKNNPFTPTDPSALARQCYEEQQHEQDLIDQQLHLEMDMDDHHHPHPHPHPQHPSSPPETVMSLDGTPLTPIQAGDGRWLVADSSSFHDAEPYMATGYEADMTMRREYDGSAAFVRQMFDGAEAEPKQITTDMFGRAAPAAGSDGGMQTFRGAAAAAAAPLAPHADPVYKTMNVGVDYARQVTMENRYAQFMMRRGDEEML